MNADWIDKALAAEEAAEAARRAEFARLAGLWGDAIRERADLPEENAWYARMAARHARLAIGEVFA